MRLIILFIVLSLVPGALAEITEHAGFPREFSVDISNAIIITDINNNTSPEIVVSPNSHNVYVYSSTGDLLWKAIAGTETPSLTTSPLVADIDGDGYKEIVQSGGSLTYDSYINKIFIFNSNGNLVNSYELGSGYTPSSPAYANGLILVGLSGSFSGMYAYDITGLKWSLPFAGGSERMNGIAVGDIDDDGNAEAVLAGGGKVTVVNITPSGGSVRWQKDVSSVSPVIINVKGKKIVAASGSAGTFAWNSAGVLLWSNPAGAKYYYNVYSSPAVSDVNNDGSDDVIVVNDNNIYAISGVDGSVLSGFPVSISTWPPASFRARPAVYDINGDLKHEIILGDSNGNLHIWDSTGKLLEGFPVRITGRIKPLDSSPAVYDIEGDGVPEVAIGSATHLHVVSVKGENTPPRAIISNPQERDAFKSYDEVRLVSRSFDADGSIISSKWYLNGSLLCEGNCSVKLQPGQHNIRLEVIDDRGTAGTASVNIRINNPPVAVISGLKSVYNPLESVQFLSQSYDADGTIISREWYSNGHMIGSEPNFSKVLGTGIHIINLTVKDNDGEYASAEYTLRVNSPPDAVIDSPVNGTVLRQRDVAVFSGYGIDKDGAIVSYRWNSSLDGELGITANFSSSKLGIGEHRIMLEVTDNDGASGTGEITLTQKGYEVEWDIEKKTFNAGSTVPIEFSIEENGRFVEDRTAQIAIVDSRGTEVYRAGFADGSLRINDDKYKVSYHSEKNAYGVYTIKLGFDSKRPGQVFEEKIKTSFNIANALRNIIEMIAATMKIK